MLSPGHVRYFTDGAGGFVVRPSLARVRCSYARDGHSTTKHEGCGTDNWCELAAVDEPWSGGYATCAWKPDQFDHMMEEQAKQAPRLDAGVRIRRIDGMRRLGFSRLPADTSKLDSEWLQSYNEVILDAAEWVAALPNIIEAVFILDGASEQHRQRAVDAHAAFVQHFGLSDEDCPLLEFDPANPSSPFSLASRR